MSKQSIKIKSSIVDTNNQLNGIFTSFDSLNLEFHLCNRLIDIFYSHISLHIANQSSNKSKKDHCKKLDEIILKSSLDPKTVVIITDTSNKNNVALSIAHIHLFNNPLRKTLHHAVNVALKEAELFTIRCGINQAIQIQEVLCIIVITNAIHVAKKSLIHLYIHISNN